jgi:hypothetical protein
MRPRTKQVQNTSSAGCKALTDSLCRNIHFPIYGKIANYENTTMGNHIVACRRMARRHGHGANHRMAFGATAWLDSANDVSG